ncbi:glycosyltransferase [Salinimicrobium sediminilitoris]|uniref:glycosyltransferase n=1 Tax=Salinimicrobium sediminilitoris TaxID=2876715 RepID=UPI001E65390B|nr:glycosyltransferase [Salinimicrobium sediminilitoris]MCC8358543.1 glycosyltransferase [Salinimicrobium sediminilitoris]
MKQESNREPRSKIRILQLIDSLRSGGAERMSVSYANGLVKRIEGSFLCCTRKEGLLKKQLAPEVGYLFLNKKSTLDPKAFFKLRRFIKENRIDLIQAHSSSWFLALMVKLSLSQVKLVWHDHYGRELDKRKPGLLKPASKFFNGVIVVNKNLELWAKEKLLAPKVQFFNNFLPENLEIVNGRKERVLLGPQKSFKIICLANLRPQKDHLNLLKAFVLLKNQNLQLTLHLIGKDKEDKYSTKIKKYIRDHQLNGEVFIYGEQANISGYLKQADIGVLASASEGLPIALLEYGLSGLPVVCTSVGECSEVIGDHGKLVLPHNPKALAEAISFYIYDDKKRKIDSVAFQEKVERFYSSGAVITMITTFYEDILRRTSCV